MWSEIERQYKNELKKISDRIVKIFQEAIQEAIYNESNSQMTWWNRSNDLKDSVSAKIDNDGKLLVYINTDKLNYYSYVNFEKTDKETSEIVPWLLEHGHHGSYGKGMYKNYEGRNYLELAYEKIKNEFPELELEIIDEMPKWI
jgi:hypothetical protein